MPSPRVVRRIGRFVYDGFRAGFAWLSLGWVMVGVAHGATPVPGAMSERLLAAIVRETPAATPVPAGQQWSRAETAAAKIPGAIAFRGLGDSMEPLFASRTAVVVAPVDFTALKKGMTVVYRNGAGRLVAHALVGNMRAGWIAQGVGNAEEDEGFVTRENLVGVVVNAYAEKPSEFRAILVKDLVAKGRLLARSD